MKKAFHLKHLTALFLLFFVGAFTISVAQHPGLLRKSIFISPLKGFSVGQNSGRINNTSSNVNSQNAKSASATATCNIQAYSGQSTTGNQSWGGPLGLDFDVVNPISISSLGAFDDGGTGLTAGSQSGPNSGIRVAIFNRNTGTIVPGLDAVITGNSDPLINDFRMKAITPITLGAGNYSVVAIGFNANKQNGNAGYSPYPPTLTNSDGGNVNFVGSARYDNSPTLTYPLITDGGPPSRYHAGTFGFAPSSAPVENINTGIHYCTIQAAIDDSHTINGNTIVVNPGTYPEAINIYKSIHIEGQPGQTSNTIIQAPSTLPDASSQNSNIVTITGSINAEINGFTISGPGPSGCGSIGTGIFVEGGAYANIHDNRIIDIRDNPFSGCQNGVAIQIGRSAFNTSGTAIISNNTITGFQKNGITIDNTGSGATVVGNTVTGAGATNVIAQNGIQVSSGANGSIDNNTISGFSYTPYSYISCGILIYGPVGTVNTTGNTINNSQVAVYYYQAGGNIQDNFINYSSAAMGGSPYWYAIDAENGTTTVTGNEINGGGNGAGIEADYLNGETTNMSVMNNKVDNTDEGIVIWTDGSGGTATTPIHYNSITKSRTSAIHNYGAINQDATCNWYGTYDGPLVAAEIQGPVNYTPWLTNGTDNSPETGFQPVPNSCNGWPSKQSCQQNADQQQKSFDAMQKTQKDKFDAMQKTQKDNFNAQYPHPTPQQKKAFDDMQQSDKKNFDAMQQSDAQSFDQQNDAQKKACEQLCDQGQVTMCHDGKNECVPQGDVQKHLAEKGHHWMQGPCSTTTSSNARTQSIDISEKPELPLDYKLSNFPNPFVGTSTIRYDLPYDSKVSIKVYDVMGREVTTLVNNEDKKAGSYTIDFNASHFNKGSLYYRIIAKSSNKQFEQTNKMIQLQ